MAASGNLDLHRVDGQRQPCITAGGEAACSSIADVCKRFLPGLALGDAAGDRRTFDDVPAILILIVGYNQLHTSIIPRLRARVSAIIAPVEHDAQNPQQAPGPPEQAPHAALTAELGAFASPVARLLLLGRGQDAVEAFLIKRDVAPARARQLAEIAQERLAGYIDTPEGQRDAWRVRTRAARGSLGCGLVLALAGGVVWWGVHADPLGTPEAESFWAVSVFFGAVFILKGLAGLIRAQRERTRR